MKKIFELAAICLLFFVFEKGVSEEKQKTKLSKYASDVLKERADSLLKNGNEEATLNLYFKASNISEPLSSLQYPFFKIIGDIYAKKGDYQRAIHFYRDYELMAREQIRVSEGKRPRIGIEWWLLEDKKRRALEKELENFSRGLRELEEKYLK